MRINITEELKKNSKVGRMVFHCLVHTLKDLGSFAEENKVEDEGVVATINFTVNGIKMDLEEFIEHWDKQIDTEIKLAAKDLIGESLGDVNDLLYDLETRLKDEIEKRLEPWERD